MKTLIKILILEHDPNDIGLLQYHLNKSNQDYIYEIVDTKESYENALTSFNPDLIFSDYSLPSFDGLSAFKIKQKISPETPFIIVSGTLGEEKAVELIKMGVTDYVLKDKIFHIAFKTERALKEAQDLKQKELALLQLKQREEQFQKFLNLSLDVICTLDHEGKFVTISAASKLILDFLPEELIGKNILDLVHEVDKNKVRESINNLKNGIDTINLEYRFLRRSGTPVTLLWSARWDENDCMGYGIAKDITNIKKAEDKIKYNEKRFRTLLQNSYDGLSLLAADGTVLERSPSACKILGLCEHEASGNSELELIHPDDLPAFKLACRQIKDHPSEIITVEYRFRKKEKYIWLETVLNNQIQEPSVNAIVLNFRDVTERKLAENKIKNSEEKYRNLFNLSPIPMCIYDTETLRFLDINETAIRHYHYSKDEFLAMTLHDISPEQIHESIDKTVININKTSGYNHLETRHIKKNGEIINVEIHANSININDTKTRMVVVSDISERTKYIQAIEQQNTVLQKIAWTQSHIVRAPLARIMGLVNLLQNYYTEQISTEEILNHMASSATELDDIIREIVQKTEMVKAKPVLKNLSRN